MDRLKKYLLEEDKLIGHELIIQKKRFIQKSLELKDIYYNDLIKEIDSTKNSHLDNPFIFSDILTELDLIKGRAFEDTFSLGNERYVIGFFRTSRRIRELKYRLTDNYINMAKRILENQAKK